MDDEPDEWTASTLSVRETLRKVGGSEADAAVATVAGVEGSAYRRPGAKRVLRGTEPDGPLADLAERALADGPTCETLDLTARDAPLGAGLGCNGVVDLLVEPADPSFRPALDALAEGERVALLTVVGGDHPAPVGTRALLGENGEAATIDARPPLPDDVLAAVRERAAEFAAAGRSDAVAVGTDRGTAEVFVDGLEPAPELLVFGSDGDVAPVAGLSRDAGFRVTVAAPRGEGAAAPRETEADAAVADRFSAAHEVLAVRPSEVADAVPRPEDTYAVLMSHDFAADQRALAALLATEVPYVGLLGPRERFESMREALAEDGVELSADDLDRIASPVGLDLGGGDPARMALSVVGEALAVSNGRDGGRLTDAEGPVHPREGTQR
jgi:xanthine dehydrogenase accessory factor